MWKGFWFPTLQHTTRHRDVTWLVWDALTRFSVSETQETSTDTCEERKTDLCTLSRMWLIILSVIPGQTSSAACRLFSRPSIALLGVSPSLCGSFSWNKIHSVKTLCTPLTHRRAWQRASWDVTHAHRWWVTNREHTIRLHMMEDQYDNDFFFYDEGYRQDKIRCEIKIYF